PFSISTALAMTRAGARGATGEEMDKVLHSPLPQDRRHAAFAALVRQSKGGRGCELRTANALWGQRGYGFRRDFLRPVETSYGGALREVDYSSTEDACRAINDWAARETRGKVPSILSPADLSPEGTRLVLTNAIYFLAKWATPFEKGATEEQPFH